MNRNPPVMQGAPLTGDEDTFEESTPSAVLHRPSSQPASGTRQIDWADALLSLSVEFSLTDAPEQIVERVVEVLSVLLKRHTVGASVTLRPQQPPYVAGRIPSDGESADPTHPSGPFSSSATEYTATIEHTYGRSALHLALNPDADLDEQANAKLIVARAAQVAEAALHRLRVHRRVHRTTANLKRLQAHMIQAEKLASLGQLVAGIVHELNNPLTSIIAYADHLSCRAKKSVYSPQDLQKLERISEAAQRILRFSRDLVTYARPTSGRPEPVEVSEVAERALVFCEHEFSRCGVQSLKRFAKDLPTIYAVGEELIQVFVNLFTNAAHAMSATGGVLELAIYSPSPHGEIVVEVRDNGAGIAPTTLARIFEPFFTTKTDGHGTGLGLSIVHDIITAHGGTIRATSVLGNGTTFTLRLPTRNPQAGDSVPPISAQ